jgi:hypothetical protein
MRGILRSVAIYISKSNNIYPKDPGGVQHSHPSLREADNTSRAFCLVPQGHSQAGSNPIGVV